MRALLLHSQGACAARLQQCALLVRMRRFSFAALRSRSPPQRQSLPLAHVCQRSGTRALHILGLRALFPLESGNIRWGWCRSRLIRIEFGRIGAEHDRTRVKYSQIWDNCGTHRHLGPDSTKLGPSSTELGQILPKLSNGCPDSTKTGRESTSVGPKFANFDQTWHGIGPNSTKLGTTSAQIGPKGAANLATLAPGSA